MDSLGLIVILVAPLIIILILRNSSNSAQQAEQARIKYSESLDELKADPANPDLQQQTLSIGRIYSNLTRNKRGVTLFDEVALMNDINAATAGAHPLVVSTPVTASPQTVENRLAKLEDLKAKGLLTEAEYAEKRKAILSEI